MVSPELIRRYPFFAGLEHEHIVTLANAADEVTVEEGHYFFREGEELCCFYVVMEGAVAILVELPDQEVEHSLAGQLTGEIHTREVVISTVGPGEVFAWSGIVPPHKATAMAKALTPCRVIAFDCKQLLKAFEEDHHFGYLMMQKAAQVIRDRLRDTRIQSLAYVAE